MEYRYGSPPNEPYNYLSFIKHLAPVLPKNDLVFYYQDSLVWRENHNEIPLDLFRQICHWKSPRRYGLVLDNPENEINERWGTALEKLNEPPFSDEALKRALKEMTELKGVEIPTASALLTAWNPDQFGITDFKVREILNMPDRSSAKFYIGFRNKLLNLKETHQELQNCALRQIELALWYYYAIQQTG